MRRYKLFCPLHQRGGLAQMVERSLSMWEVPGSIPGFSNYVLGPCFIDADNLTSHLSSFVLKLAFWWFHDTNYRGWSLLFQLNYLPCSLTCTPSSQQAISELAVYMVSYGEKWTCSILPQNKLLNGKSLMSLSSYSRFVVDNDGGELQLHKWVVYMYHCYREKVPNLPGFEPGIFWSVVRRVIHCATGPMP